MKKGKILTIAIILVQLILISSSINAVYITSDYKEIEKPNANTIEVFQRFSTPETKDNNEFLNIHLKETNSFITNTGEPILPIYLKTIEFPLGTRIKEIRCTCSEVEEIHISKKIIPASKPLPRNDKKDTIQIEKNENIYNS
ncbi:MAG: hypothetical protein KAU84_03695, partial [Thermoplasmatales archaeon]|nr:hypothetical protein [Thermoplasmatales archaeon]